MPKTQAEYWDESKKIFLEKNNSTIKIKGNPSFISNSLIVLNNFKIFLKFLNSKIERLPNK